MDRVRRFRLVLRIYFQSKHDPKARIRTSRKVFCNVLKVSFERDAPCLTNAPSFALSPERFSPNPLCVGEGNSLENPVYQDLEHTERARILVGLVETRYISGTLFLSLFRQLQREYPSSQDKSAWTSVRLMNDLLLTATQLRGYLDNWEGKRLDTNY